MELNLLSFNPLFAYVCVCLLVVILPVLSFLLFQRKTIRGVEEWWQGNDRHWWETRNWSEDEIERSACVCMFVRTKLFFSLSNMYGRSKSITRATTLTLFLCPISFCPFFLFTETEQCRQLTTVLICVTLNSWQLVEKRRLGAKSTIIFYSPK